MNIKAIALAFGLAAGAPVYASGDGVHPDKPGRPSWLDTTGLKKGELFLRARPRLLKKGWAPVRMHVNDGWEYTGLDKDFFIRKIVELDSCTIDISVCIFYYKKDGKCLRVNTIGEQISINKVTGWQEECPPPEEPVPPKN